MEKEILDQVHPEHDAIRWSQMTALVKGGKSFKSHLRTFLPQNPVEPDRMYEARKTFAHYTSLSGSIVNLYSAWLFSTGFTVKPKSTPEQGSVDPPSFYTEFAANVGPDETLADFTKERFVEALTTGHAFWLLELPPVDPTDAPADRADYDARGLGKVSLTAIDASEVLNWACDKSGAYEWVVLKTTELIQPSPFAKRDVHVETWRIFDRTTVTIYELRWSESDKASKDRMIPVQVGQFEHGFKRVPLMHLHLKEEMTIGEVTYDPQLAHFQLDAALQWAVKRCCYAQPVFYCEDAEKPPTMGVGYAIMLGTQERMEWTSPPADSFVVIAKDRDSKREEIYRVTHAMAAGVSNNAETVGRSAESKEIDAASTRIMLDAYGKIVSKAIAETYETISEQRGDKFTWTVEGFSGYDTATAGSLLGNTKIAKEVGIPSKTFQREIVTKAALALLPEADQSVKDVIRREIANHSFEVTDKTLEERLLETQISSDESIAAAAAKAKANEPKPKPQPKP